MKTNIFSIKKALDFGYNTFKQNYKILLLVVLFMLLVNIVPDFVSDKLKNAELPFIVSVFFLIFGIMFWVLRIIISMGMVRVSLKLINSKKVVFSNLFDDINRFFDYLIGTILYVLIIVGGLILFIIPGIIWMVRFQYFGYFIIDKKKGPIESLKLSFHATDGSVINIIIFNIIALIINFIGAAFFAIGLLLTIPITMLANMYIYNKLQTHLDSGK
jgi:uncharacterized membrane protein